ncbi:1,2-diacylglycerol-3-alpha-glucose alpha-1,2-galactosyltransferase [Pilibacter termitis]|uniref:1,2-diacylglycerol-3-alpha-glucose alpha-1,2-galactosyltransferase n=1 Tax=Pilibacter termitis TaxID=263852 RepID=A0A1T4KGT9_9ENTE|nr:glycosyltransferase family 4 protein [Pilibacter termitis]SJZ41611.1 1,2-diacylglycerol-3-alpha-glucose alpha-1,2-galactosyltransferase [Pilibacter termitis]
MIKINMLSSAEKIAGQGVGSAYLELIRLLTNGASNELEITTNKITRADITHYHTVDFLHYLSTFFKKLTGKQIGYVHFIPDTLDGSIELPILFQRIFQKYVVSFYKRMNHLIVVNPDFIDRLVRLGIPREKISYIPNFVAKETWYELSSEEKLNFRKEKSLPENRFTIMGAGQIQKRKGLDDFIQLAKDNPNIQFVWAGGFSFGKITSGYEEYQRVLDNPPENLIFTGIITREEMMKYYNACDIFLLPSYNELFPMSILEAASCGAPIMLRDLELYHNILMGKYIPAQDILEMQSQLNIYANNPEKLGFWKERSKEISQEYSEEALLKTWLSFYHGQIEKKKNAVLP